MVPVRSFALLSAVLTISAASSAEARGQERQSLPFRFPLVEVSALESTVAADALPEALETKLAKEERKRGSSLKPYDKPREALMYYLAKRLPGFAARDQKTAGTAALPIEQILAAQQRVKGMRRYSTALGRPLSAGETSSAVGPDAPGLGRWQQLGPGNVGGRTRAFLINPSNPSIMYAAGVAGGVWKTVDGGAHWTPLADLLANIAVNSLAMDPTNPNVVYAGTGEGYFNVDAVRGAGIFKTTNGGASWVRLQSTRTPDFFFVNDIVISPNNPKHLYVGTANGVWRSRNAGATWEHRLQRDDCLDLEARTDKSPDVVFVACGTLGGGTFDQPDGVYRTVNGGQSFVKVLTAFDMGRVSLAIAPSNQEVIYAQASRLGTEDPNEFGTLLDVYRSTTGGGPGTWSPRVNHAVKLNNNLLSNTVFAHFTDCGFGNEDFHFGQGWYDNALAVDPVDPEIVYSGGIDTFRSDDGAANWGMTSHWWASESTARYVHADQHRFVFHPGFNGTSNRRLFVVNDGGVHATTNSRAATAVGRRAPCHPHANGSVVWDDLNNGYAVTQFYHGVQYPGGQRYFGGTQDNGTLRGSNSNGPDSWNEILGGDGGYVAVTPNNTDVIYAENTGISIQRSDNDGKSWSDIADGIIEPFGSLFIVPFALDPNNYDRLWIGAAYLWRTKNHGITWDRASAITPGVGFVSALAIADLHSNHVVAGMSDGFILRNSNALSAGPNTNWPATRPAAGFVSSLAIDPHDRNVVYATYSTFGVGHVWKSVDGGATFTNISGSGATGLPDIPAHSIVVDPADPNRLYVGTDLAVFVTLDGGATWFVENTGFVNTVVEALNFHEEPDGRRHLFGFTHGRGAWRVTIR